MTAKEAKVPPKKTKNTKPKAAKPATARANKPEAVANKPKPEGKVNGVSNLRMWNIRLAIVLLAEAAAIVIAGSSKTVELTTQYLSKDVLGSEVAGREVFAAATRHVADLPLAWAVAAALAALAATYLLAATVWRKRYEAWLKRGVNVLRWVGLGVAGGAMFTLVAMLSGVSDASTLTLAFGSVLLAALLAASVELIGAGRRLRRFLGVGALAGVFLPWLIFARNGSGVAMYGGDMSAYLYYTYATVTLLLVAVSLALYFRVKKRGKWADTLYTEKMFIGLSFIAVTVLAMQIFAGALQS
jgi:hypothetical protein